jgi:hypothetical protein
MKTLNVPAHIQTNNKPTPIRLHKAMAIAPLIYWCENWVLVEQRKTETDGGDKMFDLSCGRCIM